MVFSTIKKKQIQTQIIEFSLNSTKKMQILRNAGGGVCLIEGLGPSSNYAPYHAISHVPVLMQFLQYKGKISLFLRH